MKAVQHIHFLFEQKAFGILGQSLQPLCFWFLSDGLLDATSHLHP